MDIVIQVPDLLVRLSVSKISLAPQQVGWLSPTKPSTMILMRILCVIRNSIWLRWIEWIVLCDYVMDSLCSPYMLVAMCMKFYDFMWSMILSSRYIIMFYNTYMNKYTTCSLTQLHICAQVLSDITPHASTLLSGPGYQNSGRSV